MFENQKIVSDLDEAAYHQHPYISSTKLRQFVASPAAYHAEHVEKTTPPKDATPAMVFGSLVDELVFEPTAARYVVGPDKGMRTKAWAEFLKHDVDEALGHYGVHPEQLDRAHAAVAALKRHREARALLFDAGPMHQEMVTARHSATGIDVRCKFDIRSPMLNAVGDLKCSKKWARDDFNRELHYRNYILQIAMYAAIAEGLPGTTEPGLLGFFVVVNPDPPHEVRVYSLDESSMLEGRRRVDEALKAMRDCEENNYWTLPRDRGITEISLPTWAIGL